MGGILGSDSHPPPAPYPPSWGKGVSCDPAHTESSTFIRGRSPPPGMPRRGRRHTQGRPKWRFLGGGQVKEGSQGAEPPREFFSVLTQKRFLFRTFQVSFSRIRGNLHINGGGLSPPPQYHHGGGSDPSSPPLSQPLATPTPPLCQTLELGLQR